MEKPASTVTILPPCTIKSTFAPRDVSMARAWTTRERMMGRTRQCYGGGVPLGKGKTGALLADGGGFEPPWAF